jgi:hypothetical protein
MRSTLNARGAHAASVSVMNCVPRDVYSRGHWYRVRRGAESRPHNKIGGRFAQQQRNNAKAEVFTALMHTKKGRNSPALIE